MSTPPDKNDITERYSAVQFGVAVLVGTDTIARWSRKTHVDDRQPRENSANIAQPIKLLELGPGWIGLAQGDVVEEVPVANIVSRRRQPRKDVAK